MRLETIDGTNWREFVGAPVAVLVLGKSTCPACQSYAAEIESFLAEEDPPPGVRFGKMLLDQGGLADFKRASPWLAEVEDLPFTQIYRAGERWKDFTGGGIERLRRRVHADPSHGSGPGGAGSGASGGTR